MILFYSKSLNDFVCLSVGLECVTLAANLGVQAKDHDCNAARSYHDYASIFNSRNAIIQDTGQNFKIDPLQKVISSGGSEVILDQNGFLK